MRACQQKRVWQSARCLAVALTLQGVSLAAAPVEIGIGTAYGTRVPNRFERSWTRYRSSLNPREVNATDGRPADGATDLEFWVRVGDLFGPDHLFGLGFGSYAFPDFRMLEARSDLELVSMKWQFRMNYLLFKYDYVRPLPRPFPRGWELEVGGGYGFLFNNRVRVSGVRAKGAEVRRYDGRLSAGYGNLWRLGAAVKRPISDRLVLRLGLRMTMLYYGDFRGSLSGTPSGLYYTRDSGLVIASALEAAEATTVVNDPLYGPLSLALVRGKTWVTEGRPEIFAAIAVRF